MTKQQKRPWRWFLKIENVIHSLRKKIAIARGFVPTIIPYTGYGSEHWARILCRVVYAPKKFLDNPAQRLRGWRSFLSLPVRNAEITVKLGSKPVLVTSDDGGIVDSVIQVTLQPGWNLAQLSVLGGNTQAAKILAISEQQRVGILSDIDDTVLVTSLAQPLLAAWNTFLMLEKSRDAVPGMPVFFERLQTKYPEIPVIYLSTGAWNIAPTISRFMRRNLLPLGPLLLTDWGTTPERWFRSGKEHKQRNLSRLAEEFPNIQWILVGDDGEHDPERYLEFAKEHPKNVRAIAIRKLSDDEVSWQHIRDSQSDSSQKLRWIFAMDGAGFIRAFKELELL